jgi:uncharacterized membrane protein YhaH (DUF805 family)
MKELLFSFEGRIGRAPFWAGQAIVLALALLYARYVDKLLAAWIPGSIFMGSAIALLVALPIIWLQTAITVKRCHDRNKSGFWSLLLLVPPIGIIWLVVDCGLLPGAPAARWSAARE